MASRPAKRQRRSTVVLSDEDEEAAGAGLPLRTPKKQTQLELGTQNGSPLSLSPSQPRNLPTKQVRKKGAAKQSPATSPVKSRKTAPKQEPGRNARLNTYFGKATEEQRWHRKSATPEEDIADGEFGDAIVDDDLPDEALLGLEENKTDDTKHVLDRRKDSLTKSNGSLPFSSQRFVKPSVPSKRPNGNTDAVEQKPSQEPQRPWAERYGPTSLEELAVHKKKVQDVQKWLDSVLSGRDRQRLLLLKGPAGSGKTALISMLAQPSGFQPVWWQNPVSFEKATTGSGAAQFEDFLNRGGQFGSLAFADGGTNVRESSMRPVLLIEEFPSTMTRSSGIDSFRSVILRFLARSSVTSTAPFRIQQPSSGPPLVMIVSETLLSSSTAFSDSFTAHRLLGPEIINHPLVTVIEFNPIAPTFISKALDLVIKKEARDSRRRRMPGPAVIQHLAEMGDVRNAVNALEFLCLRDTEADWSGTVAAKPKKSKDRTNMTEMEKKSLKLVSQRETTLDMFHATGKVVHNKRDDPVILDSKAESVPKPPDHLMHLHRPKISQVDIEALLNETGTDIQTFISTLHENYALSCNGESFVDSLDSCSDILSVSDVLNPDSRRQLRSKGNVVAAIQANISVGSSDALRQDEISFNVATRGLLFNLPYPVHRATQINGRKADSFKMFYPASLRLWKPIEEIDSLISMFVGSTHPASTTAGKEGVANWKSSSLGLRPMPSDRSLDDDTCEPRRVTHTRDALTLEILPYLSQVRSARRQDNKILNRIAQFHGMGVPALMSGDEPDEEEPKEETIVKAERVNAATVLMAGMGHKAKTGMIGKRESLSDVELEKLYLEEDDIVDD